MLGCGGQGHGSDCWRGVGQMRGFRGRSHGSGHLGWGGALLWMGAQGSAFVGGTEAANPCGGLGTGTSPGLA